MKENLPGDSGLPPGCSESDISQTTYDYQRAYLRRLEDDEEEDGQDTDPDGMS